MQNKREGSVIALGTFDGVHLGHRALIAQAAEWAGNISAMPIIYTFKSHPLALFGREPRLLMTADERIAALSATGIPVVADDFTREYAATPPQEFVSMLVSRFNARGVVAGFNYTFGSRGRGDTALLQALGREMGFAVRIIEPVAYEGDTVSSTRIRSCLEQGCLASANAMLGAPYALSGTVGSNRGIGHTLGFPTANLTGCGNKVLPCAGVYATRVSIGGETRNAVTNVGDNPTVDGSFTTVETHILDFDADIYGAALRVEFLERLRGEVRFPGREALAGQIRQDAAAARIIFEKQEA